MIYSVNFLDLTNDINPLAFVKYLKDTGWKLYQTKRKDINVFQITVEKGEAFQVIIPLDKKLSDYKKTMYEAVETVAFVEGQSTERLMLFLLNPNTDILKIRIDRSDVEAGNILFDDAIRVYENAKRLILAAAQDIIHPRRYHQGRTEESITRFINSCKFGQTEIGSYVVSVVCPFAELDDKEEYKQLSIFSDEEQCANSLTRKVTNKIMTNVSCIKSNIDNGEYDRLISENEDDLISANFYEALAGLNPSSENADVEFIAQWSPAVKKNRSTSNRVLLSHDYYQPISQTITRLKETKKSKNRILGRIKKLESSPDAAKRESGKVTVVYLDESEKKKTMQAILNKEDYSRAIEAHEKGDHVELIGEYKGKIMNCESFTIIE